MAWIFHGEEEYLFVSDEDDLYDSEHEDYYIDDIDVILEDFRAGNFHVFL